MDSDASTDMYASARVTESRITKKRHRESAGHISVESPAVFDSSFSVPTASTPTASAPTASVKPPKKKSRQSKGSSKANQPAEPVFTDPSPAPVVALSPSPLSNSRGPSYQKSRTDLDHFRASIRPTNVGNTSMS